MCSTFLSRLLGVHRILAVVLLTLIIEAYPFKPAFWAVLYVKFNQTIFKTVTSGFNSVSISYVIYISPKIVDFCYRKDYPI